MSFSFLFSIKKFPIIETILKKNLISSRVQRKNKSHRHAQIRLELTYAVINKVLILSKGHHNSSAYKKINVNQVKPIARRKQKGTMSHSLCNVVFAPFSRIN